MRECVVLKGERLTQDSICDCIIFDNRKGMAVSLVELKSASLTVSKIRKKFENGGKQVSLLFRKIQSPKPRVWTIILLAKKYSPTKYYLLQHTKIKIGSERYNIRPKKCGAPLRKV